MERFPLTPNQQVLLFHALSQRDVTRYFIQFAYDVTEPLDLELFKEAWRRLIKRHQVLRASLVWEGVEPSYIVHDEVELPLTHHNWGGLSEEEQTKKFDAWLLEDRAASFDFQKPGLHRVNVFELSPLKFKVVWSVSHIITDAYANRVVEHEMLAIYNALLEGSKPDLPPAGRFSDFVLQVLGMDSRAASRYWRDRLRGVHQPSRLGFDRPDGSAGGAEELITYLTGGVLEKLEAHAKAKNVSVHSIMLGCLAIAANRYGAGEDIVIGNFSNAIGGRQRNPTVGFFVSSFPVRMQLKAEATALEVIRQAREQVFSAACRRYDLHPLADIFACSDVTPGLPLYDMIFNFIQKDNRTATRHWNRFLAWQYSSFPFELSAIVVPEGLKLRCAFQPSRFAPARLEAFLEHFKAVAREVAENIEIPISSIEMLSEADRAIVVQRTATKADYDPSLTIQQSLRNQVERTPDATALVVGKESLTYREFDQEVATLAGHLASLDLPPGSRIGICADRSVELVVALHSVLRAGYTYVPLDPEYPTDRLKRILDDSETAIVLAEKDAGARLPPGAKIVALEPETWRNAKPLEGVRGTSNDVAYLLYTSGSTGQPKGVMVTQQNVINFFLGMDNHVQREPIGTWLAVTSVCFDISVLELLWTFTRGFKVVLAPAVAKDFGATSAEMIYEHKITHLQCTPARATAIVAEPSSRALLRTLKQVLIGGEAFPPTLLADLWRVLPKNGAAQVFNMYGPTETTVWSTAQPLGQKGPIVLGKPLANQWVYLLDDKMRPVPLGVPGEIWIGGHGVARGYWNQPTLTAERFKDDPFGPGRIYRTGDLACLNSDLALEFLGRNDHQVKILGHRVELGDIETAMSSFAGVREAVVAPQKDRHGRPRLVGYYVPSSNFSEGELLAHLNTTLPHHMVPATFVRLQSFPQTPNGKIDRKALPVPRRAEVTIHDDDAVPHSGLEWSLCEIFKEVLGVEGTSLNQNSDFFKLGGDSLAALILVTNIQNRLGHKMSVSALLQSSTIGQICEHITLASRKHTQFQVTNTGTFSLLPADGAPPSAPEVPRMVRLQPMRRDRRGGKDSDAFSFGYRRAPETRDAIFFVHPALGGILCYHDLAHALGAERSFFGLQTVDAVEGTVEEVAERYVASVLEQKGRAFFLGGWSAGGPIALEMAQQLAMRGRQIAHVFLVDSPLPGKDLSFVDDAVRTAIAFGVLVARGYDVSQHEAALAAMPDKDRIPFIREVLVRENRLAPGITNDEFERLFRVFHSIAGAISRYRPRPYAGPVTLFRATQPTPGLGETHVEGWQTHCRNATVRDITSDHNGIIQHPALYAAIRDILHVATAELPRFSDLPPDRSSFAPPT